MCAKQSNICTKSWENLHIGPPLILKFWTSVSLAIRSYTAHMALGSVLFTGWRSMWEVHHGHDAYPHTTCLAASGHIEHWMYLDLGEKHSKLTLVYAKIMWYLVCGADTKGYPRGWGAGTDTWKCIPKWVSNPYCRDIQIRKCEWWQGNKMTKSKSPIKNS